MSGVCGIYEALWLARLHQASAQALYVHVPFCARKCAYCDFASWATCQDDPLIETYLAGVQRLLSQAVDAGLLARCETAYIGGGTPSLAGTHLVRLVRSIEQGCPGVGELTCEANPDSLTDALLGQLPEAGCTRLSVGVQSLHDAELQALGRLHDARQATERLAAAVATGLDVSCDLMCAIPGQTDASWQQTLAGVLASGVGHVSVYPLQIEEGTPFDERYADDEPWHDTEIQASRMQEAQTLLEAAGFTRYEVASYARPGKECRHNQAYWTGVPYLGLGTQASSMLPREAYERLRTVSPQLPAPGEDASRVRLTCTDDRQALANAQTLSDLRYDVEMLTEKQAAAEDLMLAMRMVRGASPGLVEHARTVIGTAPVDEALTWCHGRGLIEPAGSSWMPTATGWLLGNQLYGRMWDLAD